MFIGFVSVEEQTTIDERGVVRHHKPTAIREKYIWKNQEKVSQILSPVSVDKAVHKVIIPAQKHQFPYSKTVLPKK